MSSRPVGRLLDLEYRVLDAIRAQQESGEDSYGFSIARHLGDSKTTGLIGHGTLYKALSRMVGAGMLECSWEDSEVENRPRRRFYTLTGDARAALAARGRDELPSLTSPRIATA